MPPGPRGRDGTADKDIEDGGSAPKRSLADILAGVLAEPLEGPAERPILAKRKRVELRLAQQRRKLSEESALQRVKKERKRRGHVPLGARAARVTELGDAYDVSIDVLMRQIATRGVVRLFNAVQQAQGGALGLGFAGGAVGVPGGGGRGDSAQRGEATGNGLSKDAFLDLLKKAPVRTAGGSPGAAYLQDDFEFGGSGKRRMKDWGRTDEATDGDGDSDEGDGLGGADAADALDAEDEGDDDDDDDDLI